MSEIVNKIKYAMSLRTPQEEALSYLDANSSHCDYKKDSKDVVETAASEYCEKQRKVKAGFDFPSFCFAMATGIGKTRLMGACIYHLYKTKGYKHFFILAPGNTIYDKLRKKSNPNHPKYIFKGLEAEMGRPKAYDGENYDTYPMKFEQMSLRIEKTSEIQLFIFNIGKIFNSKTDTQFNFHKFKETLGASFADVLAQFDDLVICMDEAHRYYAPASMKAINYLKPVLGLEFTATPKTTSNVIYAYYNKLNISETETLSFASSIVNVLLPNSGYEFAYWTADTAVYQVGGDTAIPAGTALSSDQIQNEVTVKSDVTFTANFKQISDYPDNSVIASATIENAKFDYQPGDTPQAIAWVAVDDMDKYEIDYECWQQFENNEPVAAWYSDNGSHGSLPTITKFESGNSYVYSLMLKPKEGYSFSSETVITVNGNKVSAPFVGGSMYIPAVKTITIRTVSVIDVVEINGATVSFKDGDKPVFTGNVPEGVNYVLRAAWWELNSTTGLISTEPEFGSGIYENKITTFETGKTYHYGVYVVTYRNILSEKQCEVYRRQ